MKLGADRKKVAFLGGLVVVGAYMFYSNVLSGPSSSPEPTRPSATAVRSAPAALPVAASPEPQVAAHRPASSSKSNDEFRPSLKAKRPEDRVDPMTIDPTLRLYQLAKVQAVEMEGGSRNLFQLGQPPPPPLPKEPIVKPKTPQQVAQEEAQKKIDAGPPPPPPPPPINLKYYGYSTTRGDNRKRAFFLDGDNILVGAEGDMVTKRYKVVRIGVNSVVMEDTQFKHEQTLPLTEEAAAG
jgi:hypothetical protein